VIARLDAQFPSKSFDLNRELANPGRPGCPDRRRQDPEPHVHRAATRRSTYASDALLGRNSGYADAFNKRLHQPAQPATNRLRLHPARAKTGWTPALRRVVLRLVPPHRSLAGRQQLPRFPRELIRKDALGNVTDTAERTALDTLSSKKEGVVVQDFAAPEGTRPGLHASMKSSPSPATSSKAATSRTAEACSIPPPVSPATCSTVPAAASAPTSPSPPPAIQLRDLLENIIDPSKVISDQYGSEQVELTDGSSLIGRAYEENGRIHVVFDPRNPDEKESADLSKVKARRPYPVSLMPNGLLNSHERR
jgi:hypothetical protein